MGGCVAVRFCGARCLSGAFSLARIYAPDLRLGLTIGGRGRTGPVLRHELVELFLVLGVAQAIEEIPEFGLLLLKALQRFHAVFVEGAVAARRRTAEAEAATLHAAAHPLHLVLHP